MSWAEMFPDGRHIYYEGDDPEGFRRQIVEEFGFDPGDDEDWGVPIDGSDDDGVDYGGFMSYGFDCPGKYLDSIYGSERFPLGS